MAEFVGGGIVPWYRIESIRLFGSSGLGGYVVTFAEVMFVASTFYYLTNLLAVLKKEGRKEFCNNKWNLADCFTVALSMLAIGLYVVRLYVVTDMKKEINRTLGNKYIRLTVPSLINEAYEYTMAFTVLHRPSNSLN